MMVTIEKQCEKCQKVFTLTNKDIIQYHHIDYKDMSERNRYISYCPFCNHVIDCDYLFEGGAE